MKFNVKSLLKDKTVLYIVLFFSVTNFFGYILLDNYDAVITMVLVGLFASYFSKNMIVILIAAILGGSLVTGATTVNEGFKEGFKEGADTSENDNSSNNPVDAEEDAEKRAARTQAKAGKGLYLAGVAEGKKEEKKKKKENFNTSSTKAQYASASEETDDEAAGTNPTEVAMNNLDKLLGGAGGTSIMQNQEELKKSMENLEPLMNQASTMLEGLNKSNLIGNLEGLINRIGTKK